MIRKGLLSHYETFIERVLTQDETWVHHFDPEPNMQSKQWSHPGHPFLNNLRRKVMGLMVSIFWIIQGAIMFDYLEQGRIINGAYYAGELRRLHQEIARKGREKLTCGVLLHDCCD